MAPPNSPPSSPHLWCGTFHQVGGFEVLSAMERIATDDDDRPMEEVKITGEGGRG